MSYGISILDFFAVNLPLAVNEFLTHLGERLNLTCMGTLAAIPQGNPRPMQISNHLPQANRLKAECLIRSLPGPVKREMFFNNPSPESVGYRRHGNALVVIA
jgi:hypothetical protein